ncbi:hypothetical protein F2Q69_00010682 [Brassica cretica]|uniref:Reverse transcriptase zinc-binding domain-containing protein n=1 Tax=Brassica cretica TaxID=69181 RepID=A0A8S9R9J1_BRACR|nr:hypothetical protein F2Q69_00010682 [Brassica cretica]
MKKSKKSHPNSFKNKNAKICEVFLDGDRRFRRCRDQRIQNLILDIRAFPVSLVENVRDGVQWRNGEDTYGERFVSKATWDLTRYRKQNVVWFPQGVPRFVFITWLAIRNRLSTSHRTSQWGHPQGCLFCGEPDETRDHIFFACPYTFTLWIKVVGNLFGQEPDPDWDTTMAHLLTGSFDRLTFILLRLVLQVTIYYIWRERNDRKHNNSARPVNHVSKLIDKTVRNRITSTGYALKPRLQGLMRRWFEAHIL